VEPRTAGRVPVTALPGPLWPLMLPSRDQGRDATCAVSATGVRVTFADGRELLCGSSGLWNVNLGYGNRAVAAAAAEALRDASYLSVWGYENVYARRAAAALVDLAGAGHFARVLFSTSGGAANDMAMKLCRHYHVLRGDPERRAVLGLRNAFHGLTYGAFALTDAQLGQRMYGVDRRLVGHVTPNDAAELERTLARLRGRVAAVVVEPVLGTAALPLDDAYVAALLRMRREHGFLLVADEVSTGFGRLGRQVFETRCWPEPPDLLITAKGLTNGTMAASAVVVSDAVARPFVDSDAILGHAETQAGTPVACNVILATIAETRRLDAVAAAARLSARLDGALARLVEEEPLVRGTAGRGCLRAVLLAQEDGAPLSGHEVSAVVAAIRDAGALLHPGPSCVQLLPALTYTDDELEELLGCLRAGLAGYRKTRIG
jgi:adenosylmethionine-8-amino-7-oxononanoate aminotransferase